MTTKGGLLVTREILHDSNITVSLFNALISSIEFAHRFQIPRLPTPSDFFKACLPRYLPSHLIVSGPTTEHRQISALVLYIYPR